MTRTGGFLVALLALAASAPAGASDDATDASSRWQMVALSADHSADATRLRLWVGVRNLADRPREVCLGGLYHDLTEAGRNYAAAPIWVPSRIQCPDGDIRLVEGNGLALKLATIPWPADAPPETPLRLRMAIHELDGGALAVLTNLVWRGAPSTVPSLPPAMSGAAPATVPIDHLRQLPRTVAGYRSGIEFLAGANPEQDAAEAVRRRDYRIIGVFGVGVNVPGDKGRRPRPPLSVTVVTITGDSLCCILPAHFQDLLYTYAKTYNERIVAAAAAIPTAR